MSARREADGAFRPAGPTEEPVGGFSDEPITDGPDAPDIDFTPDSAAYVPPPAPEDQPNHPTPPLADKPNYALRRPDPKRAAAPDKNTPPAQQTDRHDRSLGRATGARLPRQVPPIRIEEDYAKYLVKIIRRARTAYAPLLHALPDLMTQAEAAKRGDRQDAGESAKLRRMVAAAVESTRKSIQQHEIDALARKFSAQTATYQRVQLSRQVKHALGVDPAFRDKGMAARSEAFVHENVALITRIPERLHGDIEALVTRAVASGRPHPALAQDLEDRFGVAERHSRLIARDQVNKFYQATNRSRQRELGVEKFIWRSVGDERVRDEHEDLDGQIFDYDDPPAEGYPGEPVLCRCSADPIFEGDDEDEDDE